MLCNANTTGADNVAIGKDCMLANTEGVNNVAMGNISLIFKHNR